MVDGIEFNLPRGSSKREVRAVCNEAKMIALDFWILYNEPWNPGGWTVRVFSPHEAELRRLSKEVDLHLGELGTEYSERHISEDDDWQAFGFRYQFVRAVLSAHSQLMVYGPEEGGTRPELDTLVHVMMNQRGMSVRDEIRWAGRFLFARVRVFFKYGVLRRPVPGAEGPATKEVSEDG